MTSTQVQYWTYKEGQRHNLAYEAETHRHNVVTEGQENKKIKLSVLQLRETKRHNKATEKLGVMQLNEAHRHNVVTENETIRHNLVGENISRNLTSSQIKLNEANAALTKLKSKLSSKDLTYYEANKLLGSKNALAQYLGLASLGLGEIDSYYNSDGTINTKKLPGLIGLINRLQVKLDSKGDFVRIALPGNKKEEEYLKEYPFGGIGL